MHTNGQGITEINEQGPVFEGKTYPLDCLIYATGFVVQKTGIYNDIRGLGGLELNDKYKDGMRTVFGVHSSGYPNLFIMGGYQASFQFNLTFMLQSQADHIAECISYVRGKGHTFIDAAPDTEQWWIDEVIKNRGAHQPQQGVHARLLQFEGEEQAPAGRQLQRHLPAVLRAHELHQEEHGAALPVWLMPFRSPGVKAQRNRGITQHRISLRGSIRAKTFFLIFRKNSRQNVRILFFD